MAWHWRNGRLLNDEELNKEVDAQWAFLCFAVPVVALGLLGYSIGGKWVMLPFGAAGAVIGVVFNRLLSYYLLILAAVAVVAGAIFLAIKIFMGMN